MPELQGRALYKAAYRMEEKRKPLSNKKKKICLWI